VQKAVTALRLSDDDDKLATVSAMMETIPDTHKSPEPEDPKKKRKVVRQKRKARKAKKAKK